MSKKTALAAALVFLVTVLSNLLLAQEEKSLADKKIIGFAPDRVNQTYLREHIAEIEELPIDGLLITVLPDGWMGRKDKRNLLWFGGAPFTRKEFSQAVADLKATKFKRFTDNFLDFPTTVNIDPFWVGELLAHPPSYTFANVDWFDEEWSKVAENGAVAAYVAREGGLKGLFIDKEAYGYGSGVWKCPFLYNIYRQECVAAGLTPRSLAECIAQIRRRGREFMEAVTAVYPDITIIFIQNTGWTKDDLTEPFVKGMMERRGKATIIDGGEGGYRRITHKAFARLRKRAEGVHQADKLLEPIQYAFGVWVDPMPNKYGGWHTDPADFDKNYRSPSELEHTLHGALTAADRYVWLYIWHPQLWYQPHVRRLENLAEQAKQCVLCPHTEVPQAYLDAIRNCRKPHDLAWSPEIKQDRFAYFDEVVLVEGNEISEDAKNLLENPGFESWTRGETPSPTGWISRGVVSREEELVKSGKYSARLTTAELQAHVMIDQEIPARQLAGKTVTFGSWIRTNVKEGVGLHILDFVGGMHELSGGGGHPGDGSWRFGTVTRTIRTDADGIVRLRLSAHIGIEK